VTICDWLIARQLTQLADYRVVDSTGVYYRRSQKGMEAEGNLEKEPEA
jgi:hypothetical protein